MFQRETQEARFASWVLFIHLPLQHLHIGPHVPEGGLGGRVCVSDLVCLCVPGSQPCVAHGKDSVTPPEGLVELVQAYLSAQEHC